MDVKDDLIDILKTFGNIFDNVIKINGSISNLANSNSLSPNQIKILKQFSESIVDFLKDAENSHSIIGKLCKDIAPLNKKVLN